MSIQVYAPAIRDAIAKQNLRQMKSLLVRARAMARKQGDLPTAIKRLQSAISKLSKTRS